MDKSFVLIALCLGTLLIGLAVAFYQLWSANKAQEQGEHSALAKRFGGKVLNRFAPIDDKLTSDRRLVGRKAL